MCDVWWPLPTLVDGERGGIERSLEVIPTAMNTSDDPGLVTPIPSDGAGMDALTLLVVECGKEWVVRSLSRNNEDTK